MTSDHATSSTSRLSPHFLRLILGLAAINIALLHTVPRLGRSWGWLILFDVGAVILSGGF